MYELLVLRAIGRFLWPKNLAMKNWRKGSKKQREKWLNASGEKNSW
jgi:hypothetical protein